MPEVAWGKKKAEAFVLFKSPTKAFKQNKGLDANKDGQVTKAEAATKCTPN